MNTSAPATSTIGRRKFWRRLFAITAVLTPATAHAQKPFHDVTIGTGQLTASDHEIKDGYFAIGQATTVMVRPGSVPHDLLKSNNYSNGDLIWRVRG